MRPICVCWMTRFLLDLLNLLHVTPFLVFPPNILLNQVLHLILMANAFSFIYLEARNFFVNDFFFFLNGSWWDFRLFFFILFSVCCGCNNKFSSVFIEPFNIVLISSSCSLSVWKTFNLSSTRNAFEERFCKKDFAHHLIVPNRLVRLISKLFLSW